MSEPVPKSTKRYVALFDFTSKVNMSDAPGTLLSFKKGNQDWFFGKDAKQREGWFPERYVFLLSHSSTDNLTVQV
jgi:hypothetical protein